MKLFLTVASGAATVAAQPCAPLNAVNASWAFAGPSTYISRGDDTKMASAGAAQDIVAGANGTWFLGSVNGGVWRTTTLQQALPHWVNVLDGQPVTCSSIAALHVSAINPQRVYAGCGGSTSSMQARVISSSVLRCGLLIAPFAEACRRRGSAHRACRSSVGGGPG